MSEPLGQKFLAIEKDLLITANPFNVLEYDDFLTQYASDILTTINQNLLLNSLNIYENTIYACHVEDVLDYSISQNLKESETIEIYYPYLKKLDIINKNEYLSKLEDLKIETYNLVSDEKWIDNSKNIKLFNDITNKYTSLNLIEKEGIKKLKFIINPEYNFHLPLDLIFKILNSDQNIPLIKYNPGKKQENIYRFYTDKIATNGKKFHI